MSGLEALVAIILILSASSVAIAIVNRNKPGKP